MHSATIFEAKTNLSELLRRAQLGEEVQITSGRERKPVARLVAIDPAPASRRIGFLKGRGKVGPEFFDPLPEDELRLWNGEGE
ncbi:MAG: toxin-antitoxin system subunit antitoxin [Terracidiphilus sp.]|jgi:antitoxin (DNA-binding transcriptional repressor) of toxin-antitoxin stability system